MADMHTLFLLLNQPCLPHSPMTSLPTFTSTFLNIILIPLTSNLSIYNSITIGSPRHIYLGIASMMSYCLRVRGSVMDMASLPLALHALKIIIGFFFMPFHSSL
jgi:hypothetical protein